ncbi:hypothetical protein NLO413_0137 [Candidatus Neoehrlichia lotoris str. RAC413]|uniref:Uncharacterized protein n=1 Tax=Candidatus Neoehrlichia procyonis str. RAC413 TaxID=1359163 RepID=A0A0F3NL43_9RICK|nr:hypothetical protein NLO413_0137 [Candidatus Neoehrlichia lotoris str. RAC413]
MDKFLNKSPVFFDKQIYRQYFSKMVLTDAIKAINIYNNN